MVHQIQKIDRRKERTRQLLRDALMELIAEKGYEPITIQDITERANVARPTFYLHYRDKEELLLTSLPEQYEDLVQEMGEISPFGLLADGTPAEVVAFRHVSQYRDFYRVMLVQPGVGIFINQVRHYLARFVEKHVVDCFPSQLIADLPINIIAHREAGALVGMISVWLETGLQETPEEMAHLYYKSGHRGIWHALGIAPPDITAA